MRFTLTLFIFALVRVCACVRACGPILGDTGTKLANIFLKVVKV